MCLGGMLIGPVQTRLDFIVPEFCRAVTGFLNKGKGKILQKHKIDVQAQRKYVVEKRARDQRDKSVAYMQSEICTPLTRKSDLTQSKTCCTQTELKVAFTSTC